MKYGLSPQQMAEITGFFEARPEVEEVILFGSRATETYREASDVDIALKGAGVTAGLAARLKSDLEEETSLPFFFDLLAYDSINSCELKKHIARHGQVIYQRGGG